MKTYIVMGVSGCGKSLIGSMLAEALGGVFEDADDFHPPANKVKMGAKIPLTDEDRWPWLQNLRDRIVQIRSDDQPYVLACSALKEIYRDVLRGKSVLTATSGNTGTGVNEPVPAGQGDAPEHLQFIYLKGSRDVIASRLGARKGHFMPSTLLDSQFATLEEPHDALVVDIDQPPAAIVQDIMGYIQSVKRVS